MPRCCRVALFLSLGVSCLPVFVRAAEAPADAILYQDVTYVSLDKLADFLGGKSSLSKDGRSVQLSAGAKDWEFANGGDRLKPPGGKEQMLKRPLLVIDGRHYLALDDGSDALGYTVERQPRLALVAKG